ncbi:MAG: minichromosome maintenance protein MCM [Candidatus Diapherotrites archaeon]|nr:minichromosome maintenance protein MCM [Candidatus Diapherotrites archaeon]
MTMESATSYVQELEGFFKEKYRKDLERLAEFYPDEKSLNIDYHTLEAYSPSLADDLTENPDLVIKAAEEAIELMGLVNANGETIKPHVRIYNLPERLLIRNINSDHINKLISIEGVINKITDVRPKIEAAAFQCIRCGRVYKIAQTGQLYGKLSEPDVCSCERKEFRLNLEESEFIDMQKMQVQEPLEALVKGEQAKNINVWLEDDLTNQLFPGDKIEVTGILRLIPPKEKSSVYSIYIHAAHMQKLEKQFEEVEMTPEEEEQIKELARDPDIYKKIVDSVAPTIYGHREVKEALALQLFGGTKNKIFPDGTRVRPDIHILLIGDPGTGKSQLIYYIYQLAPKGVFVGGKSASGAGLTATAEKDEFAEGGWVLKAGALVLASGGIAAVDEFDKMSTEDRSSMHEAMEQQRISIAKAGIVTQFKSETAVLAAANPKFGRFDNYASPAEQFNIPPSLLSRFDLIFPIRDVLDEEKDRKLAQHVLNGHQIIGLNSTNRKGIMTQEEFEAAEERIKPTLEPDLLRKYIAYSRKYIAPILTREAMDKIEDYYVDLRRVGKQQGAVPVTARQLEALVRIGEASARGRLSERVEVEDADRAIRLHQFVMKEIGVDKETGRFDIDIIATGSSKSKVDKLRTVHNIIKHLNNEFDAVTHDMVMEEAKKSNINLDELDKILSDLKSQGDVYSPKHGQYKTADDRK